MSHREVEVIDIETAEGSARIQQLFSNDITLLVGSAASIFYPTSLPTGQRLSNILVDLLLAQLPTHYNEEFTKYILNIPFEYLCEHCPDPIRLGDILSSEFDSRKPNDIHKAIATLVNTNRIKHIITTNYDTCLEDLLPNGNPLRHVVTEEEARTVHNEDRILFKIHGSASPKYPGTMVFSLRQEGVLPDWKREILKRMVHNNILLTIGYSGLDFEICPEISLAGPSILVWNTLPKEQYTSIQQLYSPNAWRALTSTRGIALLGDLRDLLSYFLGSQVNPKIAELSSFLSNLNSSLEKKQVKVWSSSVLGYAGYGKQAEQISKEMLEEAQTQFDLATAHFYLSEAQFWMGKYLRSAQNANKAKDIFLALGNQERFFDSVIREVDSLRCAGEFDKAQSRIKDIRRELCIGNLSDDSYACSARLDIYEVMIIRDNYLRAKSYGNNAEAFLLRVKAKKLLSNAAGKMAALGRWHDLQTCKIWANRLSIPFEEVYGGSLQPLDDWFGFRHMGHAVVEMMAVRDSFWRTESPLVNEVELRKYIAKAIDIGCLPEVWKLALVLKKYFDAKSSDVIFLWLVPFLQCEYTLKTRLFKLRNEEYR